MNTTRAAPQVAMAFWTEVQFLPNLITLSRLALSLLVFALIGREFYLAAFVVFLIAALSDSLDGYLARRWGQTTTLGRQLDPLVDKILVIGGFMFLLPVPNSGLSAWAVLLILIREFLVQTLRSQMEGQGVAFGAVWAGKIKTVLQCTAICTVLFCLHYKMTGLWLWFRDATIWSAVALTIYSGFIYLQAAQTKTNEKANSG